MPGNRWDDINEHVRKEWKDETTPFERVYEVVEGIQNGQSAADIAERALVSEPTARRHCEALVNTGFAETTQDGRTTLYRHNPDRALLTRMQELRADADRADLLESIERMKATIRGYEEEYDALSPEELARDLDPDDAESWTDLSDWRTTRQNLAVAQAALAYDEASQHVLA